MKKIFLFAMTAATMLFTACGNDDAFVAENDGVQEITLSVENAGSGMKTRAGRELQSSEAKQAIQNVVVIVTNSSNEIVKKVTFNDWQGADAEAYTSGGHGRQTKITFHGAERLANGTYNIYAIGYTNGTEYKVGVTNLATHLSGLTAGNTFNANLGISIDHEYAEEIFAGAKAWSVTGSGSKETVVLHRQVAGVFVYAKQIPFITGAAKLSLYAVDNHPSLTLGQFAPAADLANNGGNTDNKVVNGYGTAVNTKVMSVALADWFTSVAEDANHLVDATKWISTGHENCVRGSVFMGKFIIPFVKGASDTFVLKLEDSSNAELRNWKIKLLAGEVATGTYYYWDNGTTAWANATASDNQSAYSVFRNHLYGIGSKANNDRNNPDDPEVPDTDEPQSLDTKQDLFLKVNDNWEVIHTMEIE